MCGMIQDDYFLIPHKMYLEKEMQWFPWCKSLWTGSHQGGDKIFIDFLDEFYFLFSTELSGESDLMKMMSSFEVMMAKLPPEPDKCKISKMQWLI